MNTTKFNEIAAKVISYVGYAALTIYSIFFALLSVVAFFLMIIEKDAFNIIGVVFSALVAWIMWTLRKDIIS